MGTATSLAELNQSQTALSDEERLHLLDEFLVATSLGWEQVVSVLNPTYGTQRRGRRWKSCWRPEGLVIGIARETQQHRGGAT